MSHHILEKDLQDLDHKLTEHQDLESIKVSNTPPHSSSTSSSPVLVESSFHTVPDRPSSATEGQDSTQGSALPADGMKSETDAAATLKLRPQSLVAGQDRRAAVESDEDEDPQTEQSHRFQSPNPEDEDFYDSNNSVIAGSTISSGYLSDSSSKPLVKSRSPKVQTSPAPEGCACGSPWHSSPSPAHASSPRFLSEHSYQRAISPTHSLPAELRNKTLPAETYVPRGEQSAVPSTINSGLWSGATPSALPQIPSAPANSPHEELDALRSSASGSPADTEEPKTGHSYTGPPSSSKGWPQYYTPVVEDEDLVKCYGKIDPATGEATEFEHKPTLSRSQSSGWLKGEVYRVKNACSSSIHANVKNIADVKRCPEAQDDIQASTSPKLDERAQTIEAEDSGDQEAEVAAARKRKIPAGADPELQHWISTRNMVVHELRQIDTRRGPYCCPKAPVVVSYIDVRKSRGQIQDAQELLNVMHERCFQRTPSWEAEHNRLLELAVGATAYHFQAFAVAEFGKFFVLVKSAECKIDGTATSSHLYWPGATLCWPKTTKAQHKGPSCDAAAGDHMHIISAEDEQRAAQIERDMARATLQGTIDGYAACMRMMGFVGSQPSPAWRRPYAALVENAYERGEVEPLVEFVRQESERIDTRNASVRAAEASASEGPIGSSGQHGLDSLAKLTETSEDSNTSGQVSSDEGYRACRDEPHLLQLQGSREYALWLLNTITAADCNNDLVFWIANSWIQEPNLLSQLATPDEHETRKPIQVILGELIDHEFEPGLGFYALAVRITMAEKPESWSIYADVRMQDKAYHERLVQPVRVQCFGVLGGVYDIDLEAITAELDSIRKERSSQDQSGKSKRGRSAKSGKIVRHHASDVFPPTVGAFDVHLTTAETRTLHPSVFSNKGMTLVPLEDFPEIPADPYGFVQYQLRVGQPPSTIFVNCERCLKILASFENIEEGPTVARRAEGEPGDAYIVTAISSLNNVIDSVDRVKRFWVRVGPEKYFMRANESGVPRTHDCVSFQETIRAELQHNRELARYHSSRLEHRRSGYDRLGDLPPHNCPMRKPRSPPPEPAAQPQGSTINMPASMQFFPVEKFPTAELTGNPPCTVIAVNERFGIIHGVYQGVVRYRAILGGANEPRDTVTLNIRDGLGHFVGTLTRVRHFEVAIMDGQTHEYTAPAHDGDTVHPHRLVPPTMAEMTAHPPCLVTSICERSKTIHGVYQGVTSYRCTFRPAGELGDTVSLDIRDPFGAFLGKLTRVRHHEVAVMNGEVAGFTAQDEIVEMEAPQNNLTASPQQMGLRGGATPHDERVSPVGGRFDGGSDSDREFALRGGGDEESTDEECPMMRAAKTDRLVPAEIETTHGPPLNPQASEFTPRSAIQPQEAGSTHARLHAIQPSTGASSQHPNANSVGADRIPSFLQPTSSMGPATDDGGPVFSEEYKDWLRGMYTRPSNHGCATNTAPWPELPGLLEG